MKLMSRSSFLLGLFIAFSGQSLQAMYHMARRPVSSRIVEDEGNDDDQIGAIIAASAVVGVGAGIATIATLTLANKLVRLGYLMKAYGGLAPVIVANRYDIPAGRDEFILKAAYKPTIAENSKELKRRLIALNETLLGENWRKIRPGLVQDFVDLNRISFVVKYNAATREKLLHLMNTYGAAGSLYFKTYDPRTYLQPYFFTTTSGKQKLMYRLDEELGIL